MSIETSEPSIEAMKAGAQALRECGVTGSDESLAATCHRVWMAMQATKPAITPPKVVWPEENGWCFPEVGG